MCKHDCAQALEIALVLVRLDDVAGRIVNADHSDVIGCSATRADVLDAKAQSSDRFRESSEKSFDALLLVWSPVSAVAVAQGSARASHV
jgi:hypothetical protein